MPASDRIEERTREIGRRLFAAMESRTRLFHRRWWDDWLLEWSMADEALKVQMFRFIDVLPMLGDADQVVEHLRAYFSSGDGHIPRLVQWGVGLAEPGTLAGSLAARAIRLNSHRLARRFIAGQTPDEVLKAVLGLRERRMAFTLDLLGEATITEREAGDYQSQYIQLLEHLGPCARQWPEIPLIDRDHSGPIPRLNVSLKMSALDSQFDPIDDERARRVAGDRLREICRVARQQRAFIHVDMEQYAFKDLTLAIFRSLFSEPEFRDWPDVGIALQAYLPETERDLAELLAWVRRRGCPVWVRIVKGAYWDYETVLARQRNWSIPVFTQKWQSDASFERCSEYLLENHQWLRPAIASHNVRSLAHAIAVAERLSLPRSALEFQMLYGMADETQEALVAEGHRLRIYAPFGKLLPGMAYLVRRLLENTSNTSFLRASVAAHSDVDALLSAPLGALPVTDSESSNGRENPMSIATVGPNRAAGFVNEPVTDFSRRLARERMQSALADVRGQLGRSYPFQLADGPTAERELLTSVNPARFAEVVGKVALGTPADGERAVAAARRAFPTWRATPVFRRAEVLVELARRLRARRFELAAWEVLECGKPWREADADIAEAIDFCEYYAREMLRLAVPNRADLPGEENENLYIPRGVVVTISPWNFPLAILCGMATAPLVAGNTVIVKPAEQSSVVAAKFFEIVRELDLPPGVIQFLPGIGEVVGEALVTHPDVDVISFTGSVPVGLGIAERAARAVSMPTHVKHVVTEMGGKNAIIVDDDADLDEAVRGVLVSAFGYSGQKCSACSRVITLPRIHDLFVERLIEGAASLPVGPPEEPGTMVGPVIDQGARDRLLAAIDEGKQTAKCLFAGDTRGLEQEGYYVAPHIFEASPDSMLAQKELFGPVLSVLRARDLDDAIRLALKTPYALTGGLYSRNPRVVDRIRAEFLVGNLYINRKITGAEVGRQPFGGFGLSGTGAKAGGPDYLKHFLWGRSIAENTLRRGFAPEEDEPGI